MRIKVTTKYYTEEKEVHVPVVWSWEIGTWMLQQIEEGRIPGLIPGATEFHVLVKDLDTGIPYLFPLGQKEVL